MKKSDFLVENSFIPSSKKLSPPESQQVVNYALHHESFRQLWCEKYFLCLPSLRELILYPKESLGFSYAAHMLQNSLSPRFFTVNVPEQAGAYLTLLSQMSHEIWHVVTGYDTSLIGETALQAFYTAQTGSALSAALVASGISLATTRDPLEVQDLFKKLSEGYERGKKCKFLLGVRWESYLEMPLARVRSELGL